VSTQLELLDGLSEAQLYHDDKRRGYFSVLWRVPEGEAFEQCDINGDWRGLRNTPSRERQESYPLERMANIIPMLPKDRDTWLSQAEFFRPNRQLVNLLRLPVCFVDVDTYNSEYAALTQEQALRDILMRLDDEGLPHPSLALSSGRGLQLKWLLQSPLPRKALCRWTAVQRELCKVLEPFGGDKKATDGSRVLRLVHTLNTKSGTYASVVYTQEKNGRVAHFDFDELAAAALPYTRKQLEEMREQSARKGRKGLVVIPGGRHGLKRGNWSEYNWLRLEDFRRLCQDRFGGCGASEGWRDAFVFQAVLHTALALNGIASTNRLHSEAVQLTKELAPTLSHREAIAYTSSVATRAKRAAAGEKVVLGSVKLTPLYTYRTDTLIEQFQITPDEQATMRVLISSDEYGKRKRERETKRRRAAGAVERSEYIGKAAERRMAAIRMAQEGITQKDIAERLGVTQQAVSSYLKSQAVDRIQKSVPLTNGEACSSVLSL
jgi:DNA-binding MarR family transcriptional regulator